MSNISRVPVWYWVVSVIGLLWFLMDFSAFYMRVFALEQAMQSMSEGQRGLYSNMPSWVNFAFALEVFGGLSGCVGLLLRKRWARWLLIISLAGVVCQTAYVFFLSSAVSVMGAPAVIMPLVAIAITSVLLFVAHKAYVSGWHS